MQNTTTAPQTKRATNPSAISGATSVNPPRPWLQDFWLWILLVGPLTAPMFVWLGWPILRPFADAIYWIGDVVCPKVDMHFIFLGYPMAVCPSCWGAVFGLWMVRLLYGRAGEGFGQISRFNLAPLWAWWQTGPVTIRLAVLAVGFLPWAFDVIAWDLGLWDSPQAYMVLAGFLGGLAAGALVLPAASEMRARLSR